MENLTRHIAEKEFIYKNHKCVINFICNGYYCGYIQLHENELKDDFDMTKIECHGGITHYAKNTNNYPIISDDCDWIGFGVNCTGDGVDLEKSLKLNLITKEEYDSLVEGKPYGKAKSLEFCIKECKSIVKQLIKMNK